MERTQNSSQLDHSRPQKVSKACQTAVEAHFPNNLFPRAAIGYRRALAPPVRAIHNPCPGVQTSVG